MQGVTVGDLKFDALTSSTQQLIKDLQAAQQALEKTFNQSFRDAAKDSKELQDAFKLLNINVNNLSAEKVGNKLSSGLQAAQKDLQKTTDELNNLKQAQSELETKINNAQNSVFTTSSARDIYSQFFDSEKAKQTSSDLVSWVEDVKTKLSTAAEGIKIDSDKEATKKLIEEIVPSDSPELIKKQIEKIVNAIKEGSGTLTNVKNQFSALGIKPQTNTKGVLSAIFGSFDFENFDANTIKSQLENFLAQFDDIGLNANAKDKLIRAVTGGLTPEEIESEGEKIIAAIAGFQSKRDQILNKDKERFKAGEQRVTELTSKQTELTERERVLNAGNQTYNDLIPQLQERVVYLENTVKQLQEALKVERAKSDSKTVQAGKEAVNSGTQGLDENTKAAQRYTKQLEAVKEAEKMVGKIEGIAQRWFSVYAAVNMVTKAISSMKATIAELDKTITEIAIVTNMSQSDLWGQMGTYTAMAREYAASIQGVYQVSQLYYQQGLQTADVMALTESTLKMARISGLDYAEATDYMTNAVRSFKMEMEDAETVVDVYSAIAAKSATNVEELAIAMSKTASSAESVGSSFQNTTAMMAVMIEATRESSQNIGSAMKSIISRYGELKENPAKLVDSEGEELSLNKVDTALQSVGITLHNAKGEFRDFDDVIGELAKSWDTIDINTQRYIATVMAGNRQQSRFLALVSNYDRYKELSEEAANAENAAQLQFLKTLDSIEAKTQQVQTSLQSLYTSSGLENLYKGLLDITNSIISSFTAMPTIMNLPIAAITKFGMTFWSLANVVKSVFAIIMNEIQISKTKYNVLKSGEVQVVQSVENQKTSIIEKAEEERLAIIRKKIAEKEQLNQEELELYAQTQAAKTNSLRNAGAGQIGSVKLGKKEIGVSTLGLNIGALAANIAGTALKSSNNQILKSAGGISSIAGSAMQGAAMGSVIPGLGTGVGAAIGTVVGVFQNLNTVLPSTTEQLKNLTEIAENSKNKALQEQAEAKALQSSIDKLKELEKARYTSAEAEEKYLEASNTLATQYPELISQYAKTGEAIVDLANANILLQQSLQESVSATQKAAKDNYNKAKLERDKELGEQSPINNLNFDSINAPLDRLLDLGQLFGEVDVNNKYSKQYVDAYTGDSEGVLNLIKNSDVQSFVDKYLNGNITENYNELSQELPTLLSNESIPELDRYILQAIQKRFELSGLAIQEVTAANYKLDAIGQAGAVQVANSVQLLNQTEEDILNKISNSNEIINSMILNQWGNYNGDYDKYITEIPQLVENAQNTLRDVIGKIGVDAFNEIADYRQGVSATAFNDYLDTKEFDEEVKEALKNYFKNAYNIEDFRENAKTIDNTEIQQSLLSFSNEAGQKLSSAELQIINDQTKNIISLIDSDKLTQTQGMTFLNQYLSVWSNLENELNNTQKEAAELLLQSWDGSKSGLKEILTSLKNNGVDESNKAYQAISNLIPLVSENLNTLMTNLSTSIATSIKSLDDAVKDLSKGVSIDKAVEYATKLGVDLSKFELDYSTGLWKYNDLNQIQQKYFDNIDTQISDAKTMLQQYTDNSVDIKQLIGMSKTQRSGQVGQALYDILGRRGLDKTEVDSIITVFEATGKKVDEFDSWLVEHYTDILKTLNITQENAQARSALSLGNLTGFLSNALKGILVNGSDVEKIITSLVANSGVNEADLEANGVREEIINALLKYSNLLNDTFKDVTKDVYNKAIESITKGEQEIEVTDTNKSLLDALGINDEFERDGKKYRKANWSGMTVGSPEYTKAVDKLLANGITEEEKSILEALEAALTNNNPAQALDEITSSWQEVGQTAALLFKNAFDLSDTDFKEIFNFDEISKTYTTDLKALREKIKNNNKLSQKQRNEQLAKIDKELRDTSVQTTFSDLVKNANNLSEDTIRAWADSIGASYEAYANLWRQKDGTYKIDLAGLVQNKKALETLKQGGVEFTAGVLDSVIDEYLDQLSNISQAQTSGYTNLSDMRTVADQFANGDLGIFKWDRELRAYVLTTEGIMQQAATAAEQIKSLDKNSQEYKKAWKLIQADGQALADNIDFLGLIGTVGSDQFVFEAQKFTGAIQDYNAYLTGIGEKVGLSAEKLLSLAQKGGLSAVKAAQEIAERAGKKLEGSDVETIYRSGANKINTALEQVNLSVGSVIDSTTVELLGIQGQVTDLGSGKYVINSSIDLVEAHQQLLRAMYEDNTYTLSELNALQAKVMAGNEQAGLLESMGNISELTYDTLGQIAEQAGYSLYSLYGELTKNNAVKNLGGGKIRITDFDYFADLIGLTDRSSEEYIQVLSKYNDEVISYNRSRADAVVGELKAISEAKAGDQINISNIMGQFEENTRKLLETTLSAATGAELKNGILNINDANIAAILGYFRDISKDFEGISKRDRAEIEDAFETLLNNITEQIKQGLEGKLSNVGKVDLQESLKSTYGVELKDSDFAKTADGFKMTEQAAIRVYNTMKDMDALQASLVLTELNNSLKESNEHYKSMGDIMNHIADLNKKINELPANDERRQKYQEELELAKEIAQVRATTDDSASFAFMDNKLPGAMENPLTYAENWGKAIHILQKGSGDKKGFIDARDWYNIVNEMNNIAGVTGQSIDLFGHTLNGKLESASALIQEGFSNLKSIDGGKMQVDLSATLGGIGNAFEKGAIDAEGSITKGIHAMAKSQMDMLDGLIAVLETVVAMEEAFAGLKAGEDQKLDFGELFDNLMPTEDLKTAAERLLEKFPNMKDPNNPLVQIKINGETLAKLLEDAKNGVKFSEENAHGLAAAMDALYQAMLSDNYDLNNIYASVKEVLQQSGLINGKLSIDIGTTTLYLTGNVITQIDWGSDKVKEAVKKAFGEKNNEEGKTPEQQAREAMDDFSTNPQQLLKEGDTNSLKFILSVSSEVTIDEEDNYVIDGHKFDTPEEAYQALLLKKASKNAKITVDEQGKLTGAVIEGKEGAKVQITIDAEGNTEYTYQGPNGTATGGTPHEAIRNYFRDHQEEWEGLDNLGDIVHKKAVELGISSSTGITFNGKDKEGNERKPTLDESKKAAQELLNNPEIKTYQQLRDKAKELELPIEVDSSLEGDLSMEDMQKVAELFGVDYKMEAKQVALSISMTDTPQPLQDLLNGTTTTLNAELNVTKINANGLSTEDGKTQPGKDNENAIKVSGPVELAASPLKINPGTDTASGGSTEPIKIIGVVEVTPTTVTPSPIFKATPYNVTDIINILAPIIISPSGTPQFNFTDFITDNGYNWGQTLDILAKAGVLTAEGTPTPEFSSFITDNKYNWGEKLNLLALAGTLALSGIPMPNFTNFITDNGFNYGEAIDILAKANLLKLSGEPTPNFTAFLNDNGYSWNQAIDILAKAGFLTVTGTPEETDAKGITNAKSEDTVNLGAAVGKLMLWYATGKTDPNFITGGQIELTDEQIAAASSLAELTLKYVAGSTNVGDIKDLPAEGVPAKIAQVLGEIGDIVFGEDTKTNLSQKLKDKVAVLVGSIATAQNLTPDQAYSAYCKIKEIIEAPESDDIKGDLLEAIVKDYGLDNLETSAQVVKVPVTYRIIPTIEGEREVAEGLNQESIGGYIKGDPNGNIFTKFLQGAAALKSNGGILSNEQSNLIRQIKAKTENDGLAAGFYDEYFGDNGIFTVTDEDITVNVEVNPENLSTTQQELLENSKADTDLSTTVTCEIKDNSAVLQELLEAGAATVELTVNVTKTGDKLPDENGGNGSDDDGGEDNGGRRTRNNNNNSGSSNRDNTSGFEPRAVIANRAFNVSEVDPSTFRSVQQQQFIQTQQEKSKTSLEIEANLSTNNLTPTEKSLVSGGKTSATMEIQVAPGGPANNGYGMTPEQMYWNQMYNGQPNQFVSATMQPNMWEQSAQQRQQNTQPLTFKDFANKYGKYIGQQASTGGIAMPVGEGLQQFEQAPISQIDATAEALRNFADTKAVSDPELSNTLRNLADEAYTICGVDAGQLERLYHILENLPGAANTFMNDANWQGLLSIIKQLSETNKGGEGGGLTLDIESEPDETLLKILALFEEAGVQISLNTNPPKPTPEGKGEENPPEEKTDTDNKTKGKKEEEPEVIVGDSEITDMNGKPISEKAKQQWLNEGQLTEEVPTFDNITALTGGGAAPQFIGEYDESSVHREAPPEDETEAGEAKIDIDQANIEAKGETEFTAEGAVEQEEPPAPEAPEAPAAPEAPETPTEAPEADASGVEQLENAMTDMSAYAASAVEPINGVGSGLQTINSSASNLSSEAATIATNVSEAGNAATTAAGKLDELTGAINRIPTHTSIGIDAHVDLEVTASISEKKEGESPAKGNADVDIKMGETSLSQSDFTISKAKGTNLALPKGNATTLMGELGPELYVSNGRYQVVGQHGAEFVDLPKDAIVFNHKKTAQLLKNGHMSGRGRPFTNISNALSFAKGSLEGGPAMASAAAALAALKQLRAMWASMLNASAKDLGSQAGRGGGGGGKDENGKYKQPTNVIKDIERWYNLERQIANIEKEITYQQKLQAKYESDRVANGDKIFDAQKRQYDLLGREIIRQQELAKLQRSWYDNKRKELEESSYGKIFTYDENGLQQYVGTGKPGSGLGLDILENLTRRNVNGQAIGHAKTAKSQLKYLQSLGFDLNDLIYNDDGTKVVKKVGKNLRLTKMEGDEDTDDEELYAKMMENFWNKVDGWKDELDSLYDGIQDTLNQIEENQKKQNEIYQDWINNDIDVRNKLRDAIVNREQAVIDKLQEQKDALEESTERFIDGLNEALEKDKQRSDENKADQELTKLQRQLSILQRSGGSAAQIKQLQDQISQKQEDMYFDERQKQIEAIQEASDKEIERLDQQIELLTDTLDYQKENGLLWNEVELILQQGQEAATAFYAEWGIDQSQSALEQAENVRKIQEQFQKSDKFNEQKEKDQAETDWINKIKNGKNAVTNANILGAMTPDDQKAAEERAKLAAQDAKEDHLKKNPGDEEGANKAAEDAYTKSLLDTYRETDAGKEVVKNFDSNYETWLKNRQLSDINDFTNKEGFEKNKTTFKQAMEEYYLLHKNDKDENGNLIDENTLWKESIQAGQAAIHESLGESLKQEGTLNKSAAKYNLDTNSNTFIKTTDTFPAKSVFNFDETRKAGNKNYLHIAGYDENEGWIRASQVKNGSNIVKLVRKGQDAVADESTADLSTAVVSGGDNDYYSSAAEASFILQGYTKKEIKDNWLGGTEFNKKGGGTVKASETNNAVRISDVTGIKFKDAKAPQKGIKATGKVIVDAIQPSDSSEMIELANTKSSNIGSGKQAKINSFITSENSEMLRKIKYLMAYKEGGMAYATGPAWLDGTKTKPEAVLNAKQTEFLKHDLLGSQNDSLMSMIHQLQDIYEQNTSNVSNISNNDIGTFIERIDVTFESGVIRDDYDMKRASNMFKNELLRIARKTTTVNVKRR